jgi:hypothetical protein
VKKKFFFYAVIIGALLTGCQWFKWKEFVSPEGRFSVLMPGTPTVQAQKLNTPVGTIELYVFVVERDGSQYLVAYNDYPEAVVKSGDPEKILDGARGGVVANVKGRLLSEVKITLQQSPGRELKVMIPNGAQMMQTRLYFVKNRLYQVGVVTTEAGAAAKDILKFLESFKLLAN